jgi:lysophospholipase L1-like esterase
MNKLKEVNLAEGGTGYPIDLALKQREPKKESLKACGKLYCNDYYEAFVEFKSKNFLSPDFIFITGGRNNTGISEHKTSIPEFLNYVRDAFPKAQIFVISPIGDATPVSQNIIELRQILRTSLKKIPNAHYIDLRDPLLGHPEFLVSDNVHPNDEGMRAIAGALDQAFKSIVKAK